MDIQSQLKTLCSAAQWQLIEQFIALLLEHNKKVNLISRQDTAAVFEHHVAASFLYIILERLHDDERILDIGSGGGFPGIINAILWPKSEFILVDSTRKKVDFLKNAISLLRLTNTQALWSRVENLTEDTQWLDTFDHVTSRAVAPLEKLIQWSKPLLKKTGSMEALKGNHIELELKKLHTHYHLYTTPENWQTSDYLNNALIVSISSAVM